MTITRKKAKDLSRNDVVLMTNGMWPGLRVILETESVTSSDKSQFFRIYSGGIDFEIPTSEKISEDTEFEVIGKFDHKNKMIVFDEEANESFDEKGNKTLVFKSRKEEELNPGFTNKIPDMEVLKDFESIRRQLLITYDNTNTEIAEIRVFDRHPFMYKTKQTLHWSDDYAINAKMNISVLSETLRQTILAGHNQNWFKDYEAVKIVMDKINSIFQD